MINEESKRNSYIISKMNEKILQSIDIMNFTQEQLQQNIEEQKESSNEFISLFKYKLPEAIRLSIKNSIKTVSKNQKKK